MVRQRLQLADCPNQVRERTGNPDQFLKGILQYEVEDIPDTYDKVLVGHLALEGSIIVGDEFDDANN